MWLLTIVGVLVVTVVIGRTGGSGNLFEAEDVQEYGLDSARSAIVARYLNHLADTLREHPQFEQTMKAADGEDSAFEVGMAMTTGGVSRLAPAAIDTFAGLFASMLQKAPSSECSRLLRGARGGAIRAKRRGGLFRMIGRLDTVDLKRYMSISVRASLAGLKGDPRGELSEQEASRAWKAFSDALNTNDRQRFARVLEDSLSDGDKGCWALTKIWSTVPLMEGDEKVLFVRMMLPEDGQQ